MSARLNLAGQSFGKLLVLSFTKPNFRGRTLWLCLCECARTTEVIGSNLRSGNTKACPFCTRGDVLADKTRTHGKSGTTTWKAWANMLQRCFNPNHPKFKNWGGRGITVCTQWLVFDNFYVDNGDCPEGLTLDRYPDNNGNYEPGNTRWATHDEQNANKRVPNGFAL